MNKGFILLQTIIFFLIFTMILNYNSALLRLNLSIINNDENIKDCLEIEKFLINKITLDLKKYREKDFKMVIENSVIDVKYDDTKAFIVINGKCQCRIKLYYDDFEDVIADYFYY